MFRLKGIATIQIAVPFGAQGGSLGDSSARKANPGLT